MNRSFGMGCAAEAALVELPECSVSGAEYEAGSVHDQDAGRHAENFDDISALFWGDAGSTCGNDGGGRETSSQAAPTSGIACILERVVAIEMHHLALQAGHARAHSRSGFQFHGACLQSGERCGRRRQVPGYCDVEERRSEARPPIIRMMPTRRPMSRPQRSAKCPATEPRASARKKLRPPAMSATLARRADEQASIVREAARRGRRPFLWRSPQHASVRSLEIGQSPTRAHPA